MSKSSKYELRPATPDEYELFYSMEDQRELELGCIGYLRADFGRGGKEFWHSWWPIGPEEWNSDTFKADLDEVMSQLRQTVLKDLRSMQGYCREHGGEIDGGWRQNYGYVVETEKYRYLLRCNPVHGDNQAYLRCFDKQVQEMNMAQRQREGSHAPAMTGMGGMT